ncbi:MAG: NACHT domain-containing protein [Anaerolineales bacterium]
MSTPDQFLLALQAYQDIQAELRQESQSLPVPAEISNPGISTARPATLPGGSLLLGLADDGLPVLLDLYDPAPGPLLVAGDGGSGKTAFLQSLARAAQLQDPGDIQFGVLTPFPEEWNALEALPHCLGIWPAWHPSAQAFLSQLVSWAGALPETRQAVLLLVDGFDLMDGSDYQSRQDLRWLLMYGPERHVWPVVSVNPARLNRLHAWLEYFHSRVIGQVKHIHTARLLLDDPQAGLADLLPGVQFGLSQPDGWLKFWLPPLNE